MDKMQNNLENYYGVLIMQLNSISVMDLVAYGGAGLGIIVALLDFLKVILLLGTICHNYVI